MIDKYQFWNMFIVCIENGLTIKQTKYICLKFICGKKIREIAELEKISKKNKISYQSVSYVLQGAYKKFRKRKINIF